MRRTLNLLSNHLAVKIGRDADCFGSLAHGAGDRPGPREGVNQVTNFDRLDRLPSTIGHENRGAGCYAFKVSGTALPFLLVRLVLDAGELYHLAIWKLPDAALPVEPRGRP